MPAPTHMIVETRAYTAQLERLGVSETERQAINDRYAGDPGHGKVIRNTGGLRKGRIAKDDTGKSSGYRVFSFYLDAENPVFLLWIIDKTDDDTLTAAQEKAFRKATRALKEQCR